MLLKKLCSIVMVMTTPTHETDPIEWLNSAHPSQRATVTLIGKILNVSRNTASSRINAGLSADDLIAVCRHLGVNPVDALVDLGHLNRGEVLGHIDSDGTLLAAATPDQLLVRLAEESLPLSDRIAIGVRARDVADRMG